MKTTIALSTVALLMTSAAAYADCSANGNTVVCSGLDPDGFDDSTDFLSVTVEPGAVVTDSGDAMKIEGFGNDLTNNGTIDGGDEAVVGGDLLTVTNNGDILASDKAIDTEGFDGLWLDNYGQIVAGDKAVRAGPDSAGVGGNGLTLFNAAGALIDAGDEGVETGNDALIENFGTIIADEDAIQLGENGWIYNEGDILSRGVDGDGIDIDSGQIENTGLIASTAPDGAGVDVDAAFGDLIVINSGVIAGATGILVEDGSGGPANTVSQQIANFGVIQGFGGDAFYLGAGRDLVAMGAGSLLIGAGRFGDDDDGMFFDFGYFDSFAGVFPSLFGGQGIDQLGFADVSSRDVLTSFGAQGALTLDVFGAAGQSTVSLFEFEKIVFADGAYRVGSTGLSPVPLPAGGVLLAAALATLALRRRRG